MVLIIATFFILFGIYASTQSYTAERNMVAGYFHYYDAGTQNVYLQMYNFYDYDVAERFQVVYTRNDVTETFETDLVIAPSSTPLTYSITIPNGQYDEIVYQGIYMQSDEGSYNVIPTREQYNYGIGTKEIIFLSLGCFFVLVTAAGVVYYINLRDNSKKTDQSNAKDNTEKNATTNKENIGQNIALSKENKTQENS